MILKEMKQKVLGLIEELNPEHPLLTKDIDISTKFNDVTNQVMYELARIKKIPKYCEIEVNEGDLIDFARIEKECGYEVFQVDAIKGVKHVSKARGTIYKMLENGTAEIEIFVYPERITSKTNDSYEFELTPDVLEIMPFGIAADLLKSDESANFGKIYSDRYETMLNRLDIRYQMSTITIEGGVNFG
jgi:hypothetical protein